MPGNEALTREVGQLREKWACHLGSCPNDHCFVKPNDGTHFALGHHHISRWAAAILQGPERATLTKPPNDTLFDAAVGTTGATGDMSILQRRAAAQKNAGPAQLSPIINFNVPQEIVGLFQPRTPVTPSSAITPPAAVPSSPDRLSLVRQDAPILEPIHLSEFAKRYHISDQVYTRLEQEGFTTSNQLRYIIIRDLKEMGFKRGEIAVLQDAAQMHWRA